jgi:hypothetical protein
MYLDKDNHLLHLSPHSSTVSVSLGVTLIGRNHSLKTKVSVTAATGSQYSRSLMTRFEAKALLKLQDYGLNYILM